MKKTIKAWMIGVAFAAGALEVAAQDVSDPKMNKSFGGDALRIGEATYQQGIGTHANSDFLFFLNGKYKRFHAEVGVHNGLGALSALRFMPMISLCLRVA